MTAVVGIINKQGIALAADSAVTVTGSGRRKIYNTANKLFTLSKHHPVAIMMYSSASLMLTPWETIIKMYRKQLGEKCFPTVLEYSEDFFKYLKGEKYFTTPKYQKENLRDSINNYLVNLKFRANDSVAGVGSDPAVMQQAFNQSLAQIVLSEVSSFTGDHNVTPDFQGYTKQNLLNYIGDFEGMVNTVFTNGVDPAVLENLKSIVHLYFTSDRLAGATTGLVFTGFGEDQIYPSLVSVITSNVLDNRLRYSVNGIVNISDDLTGEIIPFAQTDVIDMFVKGIAPSLESTYQQTFANFQKRFLKEVADNLRPNAPVLAQQIENLDTSAIEADFKKQIDQVKYQEQQRPIGLAVSILSKDDLAEMAESLIYLTFLKRRMSSHEESVGGPIDVAIISKGDGFIWKRRKHYFEEALNRTFFTNYFNR